MVSNFERILVEIRQGAEQMPEDRKLDSEAAVKLIMEIVDLEDQNRIKAIHGINQKIKGMIKNATTMDNSGEGN